MTQGGRVQALAGAWTLAADPDNVGKVERWCDRRAAKVVGR